MNDTYLYPYSAAEARERNELPLWRESHRANIACRNAIEDAIRQSFDGMNLQTDCLKAVLDEYGYCLHSPTLDEGPLQQAVLNAINSAMSDHGTLTAQLIDALEQELAPIPGESMSLGDIDRAMEGLGQQFNELLRKAADANNADSYTAQFQSISTAMAEFKRRKAMILQIRQEQEQTNRRVQAVASVLKTASSELTEWDDNVIYQLLEKVTVLSRERIRVTLRDGLEIEQAVEQPKRRKFA